VIRPFFTGKSVGPTLVYAGPRENEKLGKRRMSRLVKEARKEFCFHNLIRDVKPGVHLGQFYGELVD